MFAFNTFFWLIAPEPVPTYPFTPFGLLVGWIYLRFYQPKSDGIVGDASDGFSFASFFPEVVQYVKDGASSSSFALPFD
jgi:hypothetical protein